MLSICNVCYTSRGNEPRLLPKYAHARYCNHRILILLCYKWPQTCNEKCIVAGATIATRRMIGVVYMMLKNSKATLWRIRWWSLLSTLLCFHCSLHVSLQSQNTESNNCNLTSMTELRLLTMLPYRDEAEACNPSWDQGLDILPALDLAAEQINNLQLKHTSLPSIGTLSCWWWMWHSPKNKLGNSEWLIWQPR